jgi:predicted alpha/beta superfamily hydrolase
MQDGQNIVDPATSSFGVDWQIDESLDSLIRAGKLAHMIVVGIYNTADRTYEYTPGEIGTAYMELVTKTIKPMIDKTYRTKPDRANTWVGGSSAGGIISFMLVWNYPTVFSKALCMSPAFKTPEGFGYQFDFVKVVKADKKRKNVVFYLDNGGVGLEAALQPGIDEMIQALREKGYVTGTDFVFKRDAAAFHNEAAWAERFPYAILWLTSH